ncbi:hypothetical protein GCM10017044_15320 [Kordiimonas sediminis]|uniref:Uncharacterized protein n=1 Tax=Kordiimonas sediminis TaxID=1735581 RepID=A0A919E7H9_9PROT|nr:hypothetical protein GCM10017044_15320 [Kordiimonas sediminis]
MGMRSVIQFINQGYRTYTPAVVRNKLMYQHASITNTKARNGWNLTPSPRLENKYNAIKTA